MDSIKIYNSQVRRDAPVGGYEMSAEAAGAGIGRSMQQSGYVIQNIIAEREQQRQAIEADKTVSDLERKKTDELLKAQELATNGAPDMTQHIMDNFENDKKELLKRKSPFYNRYAGHKLESLKSNLYNKSLAYQVEAEREYKAKLSDDLIGNKAAYVRNNPGELGNVLNDVFSSIDNSGLPQSMRENQKTKAKTQIAVSQIERRLEDDPMTLSADLRKGLYHDKLTVPVIEQYINAADRKSQTVGDTNIYGLVYEEHRKADGSLDFKKTMSDLYDPKYQAEKNISASQADSVADLIYANYTRESKISSGLQEKTQTTELDEAIQLSLNGDVTTAINKVKLSDNINGEKKLKIINALKTDSINKKTDPETFSKYASRLANGETIPASEMFQDIAIGNLTFSDKDSFLKMQTQADEPKKVVYDLAIKQVDKAMSKGLLQGYTPIEAEAISRAKRQIQDIYTEAVKAGKSEYEIQAILSPDNITKIISTNKPGAKEVANSMIDNFRKDSTVSAKTVSQRIPGETIDEYTKRVKGTK